MKIKKLFKRIIPLGLSVILVSTVVVASESATDEVVQVNEKYLLKDLQSMAVEHSSMVKELNAQYVNLNSTYENYEDTMGSYKSVYRTYRKYVKLLEKEEDDDLTTTEYYTLKAYKQVFRAMGIYAGNHDKEDEYETFIEPIYMTTNTLYENLLTLENGLNSAKVGVSNGMAELYKGYINLQTYYEIQQKVIQQNKNDLAILEDKYELGLVAKNEITRMENDLEVSILEGDQLEKQLDSLVMNINYMIGLDITADTEVIEEIPKLYPVEDYDTYLNGALTNRIEVKSIDESIELKEEEVELIDRFYIQTSHKYTVAAMELESLLTEKEKVLIELEQELKVAYDDVTNLKQATEVSKLEYDDVLRQYDDLEVNYELGYVTDNDLLSFEILVLQYEIAYRTAVLDYNQAVLALRNAADLGPAYTY